MAVKPPVIRENRKGTLLRASAIISGRIRTYFLDSQPIYSTEESEYQPPTNQPVVGSQIIGPQVTRILGARVTSDESQFINSTRFDYRIPSTGGETDDLIVIANTFGPASLSEDGSASEYQFGFRVASNGVDPDSDPPSQLRFLVDTFGDPPNTPEEYQALIISIIGDNITFPVLYNIDDIVLTDTNPDISFDINPAFSAESAGVAILGALGI